MLKKYLVPFFAVVYLLGCGQGTDQLLDEHDNNSININSRSIIKHEDADKDNEENNDEVELNESEQAIKSNQNKSILSNLEVHYIDVGQADATLFQYSYEDENYTILYDTGDWNKNDVINYLISQEIDFIDLIIVSHSHADHIGQLADIVKTFKVGEVWLSGNTNSSQTYQKSVEAIMASDADYYEPRRGESFEVGPMTIEVLHPEKLSGDQNKDSISLRFVYGDIKFVFTGDAYKDQELQIIHSSVEVEADILQLGHHGSDTSNDQAFLQAVNPTVAIYSAGEGNLYDHPHKEVTSLVKDHGIDLYGTDVDGTIVVTTDGIKYEVLTKEDGTISPENNISSNNQDHNEQGNNNQQLEDPNQNCIDINHASAEELQEIIHIGPERAQKLIDHRPYDEIDDLKVIEGIGPARITDIKEQGLAYVGG